MLRTITLMLLVSLAAPLCAGGLIEQVFIQKIANDWYAHFKQYIEGECVAGRYPEFFHVKADGELVHYRLQSVTEDKLVCVELSTKSDKQPVKLAWSDWKPRYVVGVYPVESNDNASDLVAFAAWLYLTAPDEPMLGNRVLTNLYERDTNLRADIAEFVREREQWKGNDKAVVCEVWDAEFRKWRRVLLPKKDAERRETERKTEAKETLAKLLDEYAKPEMRTLTLAEIDYQLAQCKLKFAGTDTYDKRSGEVDKVIIEIATDIKEIGVYVDLAEAAEAKPDQAAAEFEKALKLDPCSAKLLSEAANNWCIHGNPEFLKNEWICTHEASIRKAKELYLRWLKREPGNRQVMDQLVICHEVLGEKTEAQNMRNQISKLGK